MREKSYNSAPASVELQAFSVYLYGYGLVFAIFYIYNKVDVCKIKPEYDYNWKLSVEVSQWMLGRFRLTC